MKPENDPLYLIVKRLKDSMTEEEWLQFCDPDYASPNQRKNGETDDR